MKTTSVSRLSWPEKILLGTIWNIGEIASFPKILAVTKLNLPDLKFHLQSLVLDGFVSAAKEGFFLSESGMQALGLPES